MTTILHIEVSPNGANSASRQVGNALVQTLSAKHANTKVVSRDLDKNPVPHISGALIGAAYTPEAQRTDEQKQTLLLSDTLVDEVFASDILVISTPMWNFTVPSVLKAWIDHIVRNGRTFAFTDKGPQGLITGKKLYIVVSTGGIYSEGNNQAFDHLAPYLKSAFAFLGITDSEIIRAEGTNDPRFSENAVKKAIEAAQLVGA